MNDEHAQPERNGQRELVARELVVELPNGRRLLDSVDLVVEPGRLTAIVGPSGSGKSTLLGALCGIRGVAHGAVLLDGQDIYRSFDGLRHQIGHVPQDEVLHTQLTLERALTYTAALRFGRDASPGDRATRVAEVLDELGLGAHGGTAIERLSGGQQQRASVGLELLTRPTMLFLDEPTAGLDPGYERSVTRLFRDLADGGRMVVVVTHAIASLDIYDTVVFLAPGGKVAYIGEPRGALGWFGAVDYADVFLELEANGDVWADRFATSDIRRTNVEEPLALHAADFDAVIGSADAAVDGAPHRPGRWFRQVPTLAKRTADVLVSTKGHFRLLLLQAPIIAVLLLLAVGTGNLSDGPGSRPRVVLTVLMLGAAAMGLVNSCREIVRELAVYRRERTVGLSLAAYLASKFAVLGTLALAQSVVLSVIVVSLQDGPQRSVLLSPPLLELTVLVFLTALAAVAMGLAVSAWVSTDAAALVLIPVLLIAQLVLSDSMISVDDKPVLGQLAWVSPSYWSFRGQAASTHLVDIELVCQLDRLVDENAAQGGDETPQVIFDSLFGQAPCRATWAPTKRNVLGAGGALLGLTVLYAGIAAIGLRRRDPRGR